jgi:hypothetical protein
VEIWSRILALAISCPLLPSDDDSLIPNLYLLQYDCEAVAAYWDSEHFRLSCRLVCQSWKSLLDHYAHRLFILSDVHAPVPFCQRIQLAPNDIQWTRCHNHWVVGHYPHRRRRLPVNPSIGRADPTTVQAFVDQIFSSTFTITHLATRFPGLRLLCLRAFESLWECPISLPTLSSKYTSLTHLALYLFFQTAKGESQILVLPNLHTLFVHFITGNLDEIRPVPLSKWRLPKLRNLGVRANLLKPGKENYDEVQLLIKNVGSHLQGLSFAWRCGSHEENISDLLWEWCPQVKHLEISIHGICALWPPPNTHTPFVIILMDPKEKLDQKSDLVPYGALVTQIMSSQNPRTDGHSFGMPISWAAFRQRLDTAIMVSQRLGPRTFLPLFKCFQARGYPFIDRYGIGIESEEAQAIIRWLKIQVDET